LFCAAQNEVSSAKHNLPFACANEIPLRRDWMLALLTFELAKLTFGMNLCLLFCMIQLFFRNHATKLEGYFEKMDTLSRADPCQKQVNPCHLPQHGQNYGFLSIPLPWDNQSAIQTANQ
jgi:hypothetical protein